MKDVQKLQEVAEDTGNLIFSSAQKIDNRNKSFAANALKKSSILVDKVNDLFQKNPQSFKKKQAILIDQTDEVTKVMCNNISELEKRGENLEKLERQGSLLRKKSVALEQTAKKTERKMHNKNNKSFKIIKYSITGIISIALISIGSYLIFNGIQTNRSKLIIIGSVLIISTLLAAIIACSAIYTNFTLDNISECIKTKFSLENISEFSQKTSSEK